MHRLLAAACLILANLLKLHLGNWNNHILHSEESFDRVRISASNVFSLNLPPMKTCCRGIRRNKQKVVTCGQLNLLSGHETAVQFFSSVPSVQSCTSLRSNNDQSRVVWIWFVLMLLIHSIGWWSDDCHLVTVTAPASRDTQSVVATELTRVARREVWGRCSIRSRPPASTSSSPAGSLKSCKTRRPESHHNSHFESSSKEI